MISIILIEPENPGNVGAVCRVMKNFGFENLIMVSPKFDTDSEELRSRAKWANDIVDKIYVIRKCDIAALKRLRKNNDYLIATTAKIGRDYNILRSPITPIQLAERLAAINTKKSKIGILIGRESSGLTNEEIKMCDFTVTIPTSKKYGTMNLSHAAAIILYEIFRASCEGNTTNKNIVSHISPINLKEKEQLLKMLDAAMEHMDFLNDDKKETQRMVWKKMISKSFLSKREAYALMGFLKKTRK
jgi:TrmH family RNA methyltransferase